MKQERFPPDDPREWLRRARGSLALARGEGPGILREDLCFLAQQAAEKAVKGALVRHGIDFPKSHDIARLLGLLKNGGHDVPPGVEEAGRLTTYAAEARYPGSGAEVTEGEYQETVALAERVVEWAEGQVEAEMGPRRKR